MKKNLINLIKKIATFARFRHYITNRPRQTTQNTIDIIKVLFFGIPVALIIRIFSSILLIRIMHINAGRIGEFIMNPAIYLYQKEYKINSTRQKSLDIFYLEEKVINLFLLKMLKKKINIGSATFLRPIDNAQKLLDRIFESGGKYKPFLKRKFKTHYVDCLPKSKKNINFTVEEIKRGEDELFEKFGIKKNSKFACFLIRDQAFLKKNYPNSNYDYHEYRNMNPQIFLSAAEELSKRGYFVFRMGKIQESIFEIQGNNKIIDYANSEYKSDFLDIYMGAHCSFYLTTMSGPDNLLPLFNVPSIELPLNLSVSRQFNNYLITPRIFYDENNKRLSLKELFKKDLIYRQKKYDFDNEKVLPTDPKPEDIRNLVIEMDDHIINSKPYSDLENNLNKKFWKIFSELYEKDFKSKDEISIKGKYITLSRFDINFLKKNHEWFLK